MNTFRAPTTRRALKIQKVASHFVAAILILLYIPLSYQVVQATDTGPDAPTGDEAHTFIYNEHTGLWENEYYSWDPSTKATQSKTQQNYSYNEESKTWESHQYTYNAPKGVYESTTTPVSSSEVPASQKADTASPSYGEPVYDTEHGSHKQQSQNTIDAEQDTDIDLDIDTGINVDTDIDSHSSSGDVDIIKNTSAGNGQSGDASATANVMNLLQSSVSPRSGEIKQFYVDIDGNVYGDFHVDPSGGAQTQAQKVAVKKRVRDDTEITTHISDEATIDNKIVLDARSGNSTAERNTRAGNVTSGDAHAIANLMNLINSTIESGNSAIGTVNVHGDLEGDILLPEEYVKKILATNGDSEISSKSQTKLKEQSTSARNITNSIDSKATSGNADAHTNTSVGDVRSGDALTDLNILNLSESGIIGSNAVLVFVNVQGTWQGVILDAPKGATAAAIGGEGTSITKTKNTEATATATQDLAIHNDVALAAESGSVRASHNTSAGDVRSGDALTQANVTNIADTQIDLSGWFAVLYINVYGNWNGSFGVDTPFGNDKVAADQPKKPKPRVAEYARQNAEPFGFEPKVTKAVAEEKRTESVGLTDLKQDTMVAATTAIDQELARSKKVNDNLAEQVLAQSAVAQDNSSGSTSWTFPGVAVVISGALLLLDRILYFRKKRGGE